MKMGFLEDSLPNDVPSIPEFYTGKTILITGGSGFMGKVLIEKLLYSCTNLDRIYLLLRAKKGKKSEERLSELYRSQCFDRLRRERPGVWESKVSVIAGDVMEIGLALSEEDRALIVDRVNIIFHVAASVRFDDPLSFAAKMNLHGTRETVDLSKKVRNLSALVHVSTSYSNTNQNPVEEVMYPPHADWRETLNVAESMDEHTMRVLTPKYLGPIPNTYTFTKQLAEHVVYEERGKLPAVIIRPSIVTSSLEEPMPGWVESFNGPVGLLVAGAKGIMRSVYSDPNIVSDYIPVDICIKHMIAAAWVRGTQKLQPSDDIAIYNCCSDNMINMTMGEMIAMGKRITKESPFDSVLWTAGGGATTSKTLHYIKVVLFHLLPAIVIDIILWILGKKPMLVKIQRRIYIANMALQYYIMQQWTFSNENFVALHSKIKVQDQEQFYYEVEGIDVYSYYKSAIVGTRRFLLKEKDEDLPKAKAHYARVVFLDRLTKCIFYGYLLWWFINMQFVQGLCADLKMLMV